MEWENARMGDTSPPPFYNFAVIPSITSHEEFWDMKKEG